MPINSENARQKILGDVRRSLGQIDAIRRKEIASQYKKVRSKGTPRPVVDGVLVECFLKKHTAVNGTVSVVKSHAKVIDAVADFINLHSLPNEMVMGRSGFLNKFDWPRDWRIRRRPALKKDGLSVTEAICAIAETGTIVSASSPEVSSMHYYLPENNIVIFNIGQIVRHLDDALKLCSASNARHSRGIHFITGPSKTADVEQTIQYGAHGPRRLHAIIIDTSTSASI